MEFSIHVLVWMLFFLIFAGKVKNNDTERSNNKGT